MPSGSKGFTLQEIAEISCSKLVGDKNYYITGVDDLVAATPHDISFLSNLRYEKAMHSSQAGAIFINPSISISNDCNYLITDNPSQAFQEILKLFFEKRFLRTGFNPIHSSAVIHETAQIADNVTIAPNAVIDAHTSIGEGTTIGANTVIDTNVSIGCNCTIYPNVTIRSSCVLGDHVTIQPGAVIGSCGFGYITDAQGCHNKLEQLGNVVIENHVEIGANTTIDRARFKTTLIKKGTKIDNLVQIGHGVIVGQYNLIISQVGIAGSSKTGNYVVLAGQAAMVGHVTLADGITIAARGAVTKSLTKPGKYGGAPAVPEKIFKLSHFHQRSLDKYAKRIKSLEAQLEQLLAKSTEQ